MIFHSHKPLYHPSALSSVKWTLGMKHHQGGNYHILLDKSGFLGLLLKSHKGNKLDYINHILMSIKIFCFFTIDNFSHYSHHFKRCTKLSITYKILIFWISKYFQVQLQSSSHPRKALFCFQVIQPYCFMCIAY